MSVVSPELWRKLQYFSTLPRSLFDLAAGRVLPELNPPRIDLHGRVAIVTGANSGIGLSLANSLASWGASVYLACRSESKAETATQELLQRIPEARERVYFLRLDTSDLDSVRDCASAFLARNDRLDILIHNAGAATTQADVHFSPQGFEQLYATNFLGSFLLTNLLRNVLAPNARIVFTSSHGQHEAVFSRTFSIDRMTGESENGFHCPPSKQSSYARQFQTYANTKSMQCAFAKLLQRRFDLEAGRDSKSGATRNENTRRAAAFSPGFTSTKIFSKIEMSSWRSDPAFALLQLTESTLATDVRQGAATGLWLATTDDEAFTSRKGDDVYWERMSNRLSTADLLDDETLSRMWSRWEADAGVKW